MADERFDLEEAGRLLDTAGAVFGELMPDPADDVVNPSEEQRDARKETADRTEAWRRLSWYWQLVGTAQRERDLALFRSATTAVRLASEAEFRRREEGTDSS